MTKKTSVVRIDRELKKKLETELPGYDWSNRVRSLWDNSLTKANWWLKQPAMRRRSDRKKKLII